MKIKKIKKVWWWIALLFIGICCLTYYWVCTPMKDIDIQKELMAKSQQETFSLDDIDFGYVWDSLLIVKPYDKEWERFHVQIRKQEKDLLKAKAFAEEGICSIVFLSQGKLVAYTFVPRNILDFETTKKIKYSKMEVFTVSNQKVYDKESSK